MASATRPPAAKACRPHQCHCAGAPRVASSARPAGGRAPTVAARGLDVAALEATTSLVSGAISAGAIVAAAWMLSQPAEGAEQAVDEQDACPRCHGSGYEPCMCTRWSDAGEDLGCPSCASKLGYMTCRSCGGGRRARLAPVKLRAGPPGGGRL